MLINNLKHLLPGLYRQYIHWQWKSFPKKVAAVLAMPDPPKTLDESKFDLMQSQWTEQREPYGYQYWDCWVRGHQRVLDFIKQHPWLKFGSKRILDVSCGDGMTGFAFSSLHHEVWTTDIDDWRFLEAQSLSFLKGDLSQPLDLPEDYFDFIFSFNAFEHIDNPEQALNNLIRACRSEGIIFLSFDPLYCDPYGLHALSFRMPYPQFLFSEDLIMAKLQQLGNLDLPDQTTKLQPLNRWRPDQFQTLFRESGTELLEYYENPHTRYLDVILKYPQAFTGRGLTLRDVTVSGIRCQLRKPK